MGQSQSTSLQSPSGSSSSTPVSSIAQGSRNMLFNELGFLHNQIRKHSLTLRQITTLTYDDLETKIKELNELSSNFVDCNGKQLVFELKDASDAPVILWKGLIRIKCMKINPSTSVIEKVRDLNLKQFLQIYNTMTQMGTMALDTVDDDEDDEEVKEDSQKWDSTLGEEAAASNKTTPVSIKKKPVFSMSTSLIMDNLKGAVSPTSDEECCICLESKPQVSLPCAHSYCLACIEQWNVEHKNCPICRESLENTDETWVLEDKPNTQEVKMEMKKSFFGLTK